MDIPLNSKFAILSVESNQINLDKEIQLDASCWACPQAPLGVGDHWKCSLGRLFADDFVQGDLFVTFVSDQGDLTLNDAESVRLMGRAEEFRLALLLESLVRSDRGAIIIGGVVESGGPRVHSISRHDPYSFNEQRGYPRLAEADIREAHELSKRIGEANSDPPSFIQITYGLHALERGLSEPYFYERILQLVRALEAPLRIPIGPGAPVFAQRLQSFVRGRANPPLAKGAPVPPPDRKLETRLKMMYELRSSAVHFSDARAKPSFVSLSARSYAAHANRLIVEAEVLAIEFYRRLLLNGKLLKQLGTPASASALWDGLNDQQRSRLIGRRITQSRLKELMAPW